MECFICLNESRLNYLNLLLCCNKYVHDECLWGWLQLGLINMTKLKCPACRQFFIPRDLHNLVQYFINVYEVQSVSTLSYFVVPMYLWLFNIKIHELDDPLRAKMVMDTTNELENELDTCCRVCFGQIELGFDDIFELICCSTELDKKLVHRVCLIEHTDDLKDFRNSYVGINTLCPACPNLSTKCTCCHCSHDHKFLVSPCVEFFKMYRVYSTNHNVKDLMSQQWCFYLKSYFLEKVIPTVAASKDWLQDQSNQIMNELEWAQDNAMIDEYLDYPMKTSPPPKVSHLTG